MTAELVLRNGTVVDGLGGEADVARRYTPVLTP
jgi:hypothetical protein